MSLFRKASFVPVKRARMDANAGDSAMPSIHLRDDIPCGIQNCNACATLSIATQGLGRSLDPTRPILVPSLETATHFWDMLSDESCRNVVILSSVYNQIERRSKAVNAKMLTTKTQGWWYYFPNEFQVDCYTPKGTEEAEGFAKVIAWYRGHTEAVITPLQTIDDVIAFATDKFGDGDSNPFVERAKVVFGGKVPSAALVVGEYGYSAHLSMEELNFGDTMGTFFRGTLRASGHSAFYGGVMCRMGDDVKRVSLVGCRATNRAFDGDIVCVQQEETTDGTLSGRVVGILQATKRTFCGSLDPESHGTFLPCNGRIPKVRMFARSPDGLLSQRLRVTIDQWSCESLLPSGHVIDVLGPIGDKDVEAKVILMEHDVPHYDFSEAVLECLPKGQWVADPTGRRDMRAIPVCSVDPEGCRDIDDALHCLRLPNGNYQVGVHIADVSHFVGEGTPLDEEAQKRCTSVYLIDRRIDMLPKLLTENLCSLVSNEDRYTFSAIFEMDTDGNVVNVEFTKGLIKSVASLSYKQAQTMIDDPTNATALANSLRDLMMISLALKNRRRVAGAVFLHSQQFKFKLEAGHLNPTDMVSYELLDTNGMIEEWMLLANEKVAEKIHESFPKWALLRRHMPPNPSSLSVLNEALQGRGLGLDGTTSASLNKSLDLSVDPQDPEFNKLIRTMTTRCMQRAAYVSSGDVCKDEFNHYGLALKIYTHFTSPIRRYADLVVHRQLGAAIGIYSISHSHTSKEFMSEVAAQMNMRHENAQNAGRDSQNLHIAMFVGGKDVVGVTPDGHNIVMVTQGYVIRRREDGLTIVFLPSVGIEGPLGQMEGSAPGPALKIFDAVTVDVAVDSRGRRDAMQTKLIYRLHV